MEADGLVVGQTCTTTVFVATKRALGSGNSQHNPLFRIFEPTSSLADIGDGGTAVTDTITLNPGLKLFDGATNDLLAEQKNSIQLMPIGCS